VSEVPEVPFDDDDEVGSAIWTVQTEIFEGPLDLLLYLVRRDGIDLKQIDVSRIADSYLAFLDRIRSLHLSVASEYLLMAATLVHLKSLDLLPKPPTPVTEEEVDPREALQTQLIEYARYKEGGELLLERPVLGRDTFTRVPLELGSDERPVVAGVDAFGLLDVFYGLLLREAAPEPTYSLEGGSGPDFATICLRIIRWLAIQGGSGDFADWILSVKPKVEKILSFLGILEMARLGWVEVEQERALAPVVLRARVGPDVDLTPIRGAEMAPVGSA
jgi:segregation and condensation protein A